MLYIQVWRSSSVLPLKVNSADLLASLMAFNSLLASSRSEYVGEGDRDCEREHERDCDCVFC
jgi:hypothetical protein